MDPLVEIRRGGQAPSGFWTNWKKVFTPKAKAAPKFYGPQTNLKFDRGRLEGPLVYIVKGTLSDAPDASLIETGLPVSKSKAVYVDDLPYWPSYRAASPQQRSEYIDWLVGGRKDPSVAIGYVFIYFYGLERRVIADNADHAAIVAETLRLLQIYTQSRSFVGYATRLLWTTVWLGLNAGTVSHSELKLAIRQTIDWSEDIRGLSLACFFRLKFRLSAKMAYLLASHDPQAPRSVVVKRESELHKLAFCKRFDATFPDGFELKAGERARPLQYFSASATLGKNDGMSGALGAVPFPDVLGVPSQFRPLVSIWCDAIDELKHYDRLRQKAGGAQVTAEMFEALPEELRQGDHPHFDAWYQILSRTVTEDGWTLVPINELARVEGLAERKKLTRTQSTQLVATAFHMGLALEPDPRITGRSYEWDEIVSAFPIGDEMADQVAAYQAASVLLELGVSVAAADGEIGDIELRKITSHLKSQFALSQQDSVRLEHLRYLRTKRPLHNLDVARSMRKNLTVEQRRIVGKFLVGIAAADERISPREVDALRRAYRGLGLEIADLDSLLASVSTSPNAAQEPDLAVQEFRLDMSRINSIMAETAQVAEFLENALGDDSENDEASAIDVVVPTMPTSSSLPAASRDNAAVDSRFPGLSNRYVPFALVAIEQGKWERPALDSVARQHGLMLGAAIEAINEWAYDKVLDALLVEDKDQVVVQQNLVQPKVETR